MGIGSTEAMLWQTDPRPMKRSPLILVAILLGLALLAGPLAAACVDCCPPGEARAAMVAPSRCCDCDGSIQSSRDQSSLAAKKAVTDPELAVIAPVPPRSLREDRVFTGLATLVSSPRSGNPAAFSPLRL